MNVTYVPEHLKTIHVANTVIYDLVNDVENFNKEMASDSLEWHTM
jgi:hypothetical protein